MVLPLLNVTTDGKDSASRMRCQIYLSISKAQPILSKFNELIGNTCNTFIAIFRQISIIVVSVGRKNEIKKTTMEVKCNHGGQVKFSF